MPQRQHTDTLARWQSNGMGRHRSQHTGGVLLHGLCQSRRCSRTCRGQENIKILITPGFTCVSTAGFKDPWSDKLLRTLIPGRAGPTINRRFRNPEARETSFSGGPALQFGSLQRNIYLQFLPNWTSATPANLGFDFCFLTPGIFTTGGIKIIIAITLLMETQHVNHQTKPLPAESSHESRVRSISNKWASAWNKKGECSYVQYSGNI